MKIVYCRSCAYELPDTAPRCSKCGAPQARVTDPAGLMANAARRDIAAAAGFGRLGRRLRALVLIGLLSTLALLIYPVLVGLGWVR